MNSNLLFAIAFSLGAAVVLWVCSGFAGTDPLALTVTALIAAVYVLGFLELWQFRNATATLNRGLQPAATEAALVAEDLTPWLQTLHPSMHSAIRARVEGDRVGLPTPVITPYLVGLLVMLGLLGTFMGMVETLQGAVIALEGSTELQAMRAGLTQPIAGLSLAFGTSVAGVAASAMLGMASTLSRRERLLATRELDAVIATRLQPLSLAHDRRQTYRALQSQTEALPQLTGTLSTLADHLAALGERLEVKLVDEQARFHTAAEQSYRTLAESVEQSLRTSLAEAGQATAASVSPLVRELVSSVQQENSATQHQLRQEAQAQSELFERQLSATTAAVTESWQTGLREYQQTGAGLLAAMNDTLTESTRQHWQQTADSIGELTGQLTADLGQLRSDEERRAAAAVQQLAGLEETVAAQLGSLGRALEEPMTRLIETASETPKAAAEVIARLRGELSNYLERDNQLLEERAQLMATLQDLSRSLTESSVAQRDTLTELVSAANESLQNVAREVTGRAGAESERLADAAVLVAGSATEMSSMSEAFALAVTLFNDANRALIDTLVRVEQSLETGAARSDEQLGYYVAQAREIIDQSLLAQQAMFTKLEGVAAVEPESSPAEAS